jgi:hypothetical protein
VSDSDLERHGGAVLLLSAELDDEYGRHTERENLTIYSFDCILKIVYYYFALKIVREMLFLRISLQQYCLG